MKKRITCLLLFFLLLPLMVYAVYADSSTVLSAAAGQSGIVLQWNLAEDISEPADCTWSIYRCCDENTWENVYTAAYEDYLQPDGTLSWTDSDVHSGVAYQYYIRPSVQTESGETELEQSNEVKAVYVEWLRIKSAGVGKKGITLKWNGDAEAKQYFVLRKKNGGWTKIGSTTACSLTDSTVSVGNTYTYAVYWVDKYGTEQKKVDTTGTTVRCLPAPVLTLRNTSSGVKIAWDKVTDAQRYRVSRKEKDGTWRVLGYTAGAAYTDKTAKSDTTYSYAVRCVSKDEQQVQSTYQSRSIHYIAAPTITTVHAGSNGVTVKWKKVPGAAAYRVLYKTQKGWKKLKDTSDTSYLDTGVEIGSSRTYTVRCIQKGSCTSGYRSGVTARRLKAPTVRFSAKDDKLVLSWNKIAHAEKYRVYRFYNGSWQKVGDTSSNQYKVTATSGKNVRYAVRCISENGKNRQSCRSIVSGRYTAYRFRSAERAVAGCGYFRKSGKLTTEQQEAVLRYMNAYYSSIGSFRCNTDGVFYSKSLRKEEASIWNSVIAVRKRALEDLSLSRYRFSLKVVKLEKKSADRVKVKVLMDCDQQFRDIPVLSQEYGSDHTFTLVKGSSGKWRISTHYSGCSPFFHFQYDAENDKDRQLAKSLRNITARQDTWGGKTGKSKACDHPYNREKAIRYMMQWIATRNPNYFAYDEYGGNCMNFASQVLRAGGIHQTGRWYWKSAWNCSNSWVNVGLFTDYARSASRQQLYCNPNANYYTGDVGDLVLIGIQDAGNHATIISDVIRDEQGRTVDYLLSCNTTNLKNFPAAAYHYTNQRLIRIYGWND